MKRTLCVLFFAALAGCATVERIESGQRTVGERLVLQLEGAWNHVNVPGLGPAQVWTMEGLPVDRLLLYSGVKDGQAIHAIDSGERSKPIAFRSGMQPDQLVAMFESMLTRDGSSFTLLKLEPSGFGGGKGFRFEYALARRIDGVQLSGVGFATVSQGDLFALLYQAPRLGFFPRHRGRVEDIARSARVKG